jgi:tRNA-guanine family transglycosylase
MMKKFHEQFKNERSTSPLLFGIIQGGLERDLRQKCAEELCAIGFDGYAVGGFAVTLSIGILFSMFTAITITKLFLKLFITNKLFARPWLFGVKMK